jgi:N utilization substance protein B
MKTSADPRHRRRQKAVKSLFSWQFQPQTHCSNQLADQVVKKRKTIDQIILKAAPEWPLKQINGADLAILRLAIYELMINAKEPPKVIVDEAIELAKTYGGENSPGFVNGVLGTVLKNISHERV